MLVFHPDVHGLWLDVVLSRCSVRQKKLEKNHRNGIFSSFLVLTVSLVFCLAQVLEYLKKHHEFDKTSATQDDRLVLCLV